MPAPGARQVGRAGTRLVGAAGYHFAGSGRRSTKRRRPTST